MSSKKSDFYIENGVLKRYTGDSTPATVPDGVTVIDSYAFKEHEYIKKITLPEGVEKIGFSAFYKCESLEELNLPSSLKMIEALAFSECNALKTWVTIPDEMTRIEAGTFDECYHLPGVTIPETVTEIGEYAFFLCHGMREIKLPKSLKVLDKSALAATGLIEVTIPRGVTEISNNLLENSSDLTTVNLHRGITKIGDSAFKECAKLKVIRFEGSEDEWNAIPKGILWDQNYGFNKGFYPLDFKVEFNCKFPED